MSEEEEILRVPEVLSLEEQRDLYDVEDIVSFQMNWEKYQMFKKALKRELLKSKEEEINNIEEWNGMDTFFDMLEEYR